MLIICFLIKSKCNVQTESLFQLFNLLFDKFTLYDLKNCCQEIVLPVGNHLIFFIPDLLERIDFKCFRCIGQDQIHVSY